VDWRARQSLLTSAATGKESMRVKVSETLVTFPKGDNILVFNYLTKHAALVPISLFYWFTVAQRWTEIDDLIRRQSGFSVQQTRSEIEHLVEAGALIEEGSGLARKEADYCRLWELGPAAGMFHFSLHDNDYVSAEQSIAQQKTRNHAFTGPDLYWRNTGNATALPPFADQNSCGLLDVMKRRRTNRNVTSEPLALCDLAACLYSGLGITGFVETETAVLPLKMTPSGGGRNPFEAFVWARNVDGLEAGIYHYSALQHSLELVNSAQNASPSAMVQDQEWANSMPAIIFLVAVLQRTTWKYQDPNAYRVVLIEAGHIAQNIALICTEKNLTACPTAALSHTDLCELLGLSTITEAPMYALLIGSPAETSELITPNLSFNS
jgi:SagB-type dehydrogenase family enzyme